MDTTKEEAIKEDMIKVHLDGESVWAARLSPTTAEIRNLPLDERVNYKDIVEIDEERRFIRVIERQCEQAGITYEYDPATMPEEWPKMNKYLYENGIGIEGMVIGHAMIDFKKGTSHDDISKILDGAPLKVTEIIYKED